MIDSARTDLTETYLQMNFRNGNFSTTNLVENLSYFLRKCLIFRIENCSFVLNYWHYRKLAPDLNQHFLLSKFSITFQDTINHFYLIYDKLSVYKLSTYKNHAQISENI